MLTFIGVSAPLGLESTVFKTPVFGASAAATDERRNDLRDRRCPFGFLGVNFGEEFFTWESLWPSY